MLDDIAERTHYVNLLTHAGTLLGFNAPHPTVLNLHYPNVLIPFDTCENCNYRSNEHKGLFKEMIRQIQEDGLEFLPII
jgi:hypothetical protein